MSSNSLLHRGMTDNWLSEQGLPNLTEQWVAIRHSPFAIRYSLFAIRYPEQPKGSKGQAWRIGTAGGKAACPVVRGSS